MKKIILLLAFVAPLIVPMNVEAQTADTTFRSVNIRHMINYISIRQKLSDEFDQMKAEEGNKDGRWGKVRDKWWFNDWCEYHKLTKAEAKEMFELRLIHHPDLLKRAIAMIGKRVESRGFDFHLSSDMPRPYYFTQSGQKKGGEIFVQGLAKYGLNVCKD